MFLLCLAPAPRRVWPLALGTGQASPSATWCAGLTPQKGSQPKCQVSPRGGAGLAPVKGKGRQPQRHLVLGSDLGQGQAAPCHVAIGSDPAQGQVNPSARCPHVGAQARLTPRATPPKLEVTIFSPSISTKTWGGHGRVQSQRRVGCGHVGGQHDIGRERV